MRFEKDARYLAGGFWRCRTRTADVKRARYYNLSARQYNQMLLRHRRTKALVRQRQRHSGE